MTASVRRLVGVVLVAVSGIVLALQLPGTFRSFNDEAAANAKRAVDGGVGLSADSLDINNDFVTAALQAVPTTARYAVLGPPTAQIALDTYGISSLTLLALPDYMQTLLLPRRQVPPDRAGWILCYACDTSPWDGRTTWVWKNDQADAIGKVRR
jgi:hypothetical protein